MSKSTIFGRLLLLRRIPTTSSKCASSPPNPFFTSAITRNYSSDFRNLSLNARVASAERALDEIVVQAQRERMRDREERIKAGLSVADLDAEEEEDYLGVGPLIEKLEKKNAKDNPALLNVYEEPTDSDSESEDEEAMDKRFHMFERKFDKHQQLLDKFAKADNFDDAFKWMKKIDAFEEKHFPLRPECRVIGELMNRLRVAEGKEKFLLQMKLNRALRMVEWKEAFDPNDPANYGVIEREQVGSSVDRVDDADMEEEQETIEGGGNDEDLEFDDLNEKDSKFLENANEIDKSLS